MRLNPVGLPPGCRSKLLETLPLAVIQEAQIGYPFPEMKQYGLGEDALTHADRWARSGTGRAATIYDRLTGPIVGIDANGVRIVAKDESGNPTILHEWKR
jgi:hypothetical protein